MDLFEIGSSSTNDETDFIKNVCQQFGTTPTEIYEKLKTECVFFSENFDSPLCRGLKTLFRYNCLCLSSSPTAQHSMHFLITKLFAHLIAGPKGIDELTNKLKAYDFSARCSFVWTGDYFAYRCRTCGLTPSMSLCGACFTAGDHEGHDFNKFRSMCGGACDCGDPSVIRASGNCRFHGPEKVANRPCPPKELTAPLEFLLPYVMKALMFWFWDHCEGDDLPLTETEAPMLYFLHRIHACGWATQSLMADVLLDPEIYQSLVSEVAHTSALQSFQTSVASDPSLSLEDDENTQKLNHKTLLDAFLFTIIKLRFPEGLDTLLIGLLAVDKFKQTFLDAYVDHYSRIASTLMIAARVRHISTEASMQMNNRIVHISVQLFSGERPAYRMVKERSVHYIIVKWMRNMFAHCHTRLDDRGNMVVNCDGVLIQNNAFWPLTSDLNNLLSHKSVADIFIEDRKFLSLWTDILKYMQFMNCFSMKEGNHIEYETLACYHGLTMEIEVGITSMWYIWQHYKASAEHKHCLMYTNACIETLANQLTYLGRLVPSSTQWVHPIRGPLSLHLPLSRHVACFLCLSVLTHRADLKKLMSPFIEPSPTVLRRLMEELANVLLGCHEVIIGYWIRNGQPIRQSIMHYMQSQLCYSMIDLDIFLFQICTNLLHPAYVINALIDQSRLLNNFSFHRELMALVSPPSSSITIDRQPMAVEAWLTNLCWILDLRNNLGLSEAGMIEKELVCFLAPYSRKRSDLSYLLPDRCGLPANSAAIDECLEKVATYCAPSCDIMSGSLVSGKYSMKPELWDKKFDPVFYSLRITSKRELAAAMERYRIHCRQANKTANTSGFWPPYRQPMDLLPQFADLENLLHSRHLHYLLYCLLSLYVYGDPLCTEESLTMVIHLLYRAVVAGGVILTKGLKPNRLNIAAEPGIPKVDPIECTEAFMTATNREAELEAMQFADADVESEDSDVDDEAIYDEDSPNAKKAKEDQNTPLMEPTESQTMVPGTSNNSVGMALKRNNAFRVRKPPAIPLKWDLSIVACPYPIPQTTPTIFDNLTTWLATSKQTVALAALEIQTTSDGTEFLSPQQNTECLLVDSLLSLLVKAHARLQWQHMACRTDVNAPLASVATGSNTTTNAPDNAFINFATQTDPQTTTSHLTGLAARCMSVLNATHGGELSEDGSRCVSSASPLARALQSAPSDVSQTDQIVTLLSQMAPELRYFAAGQPVYKVPDEVPNDRGVECGDGVFWVTRLIDKIVELSEDCRKELKIFIERANDPFNMEMGSESLTEGAGSSIFLPCLPNNTQTRAQRKMAASERQKRLLDIMASKQRAFADNFLKDIDMDKLEDDTIDNLQSKMDRDYDCVICQAVTLSPQPMVLLVMLCESGLMPQMRNYSALPQLTGERMHYSQNYLSDCPCLARPLPVFPPEIREGVNACLKSETLEPVAYMESRRWWQLAMPFSMASSLPLLRTGLLLQTCGHAVHRECFQRYRNQSLHNGGATATRWWATCPLCRRDVHYLLPLHRTNEFECPFNPHLLTQSHKATQTHSEGTVITSQRSANQPTHFFKCLREKLASLPVQEHSFWINLVGAVEDNSTNFRTRMTNIVGKSSEVAVLLRTQFEMELSVLMVCPSHYHNVARRFLFQELMNYLRHVYQSPLNLVSLVDSLTRGFIHNPTCSTDTSQQPVPPADSPEAPPIFALCNDPTDVFLTFLPHVWPNQDHLVALSSACICLAYARALVGLLLGQTPTNDDASHLHNQLSSIKCVQEHLMHIPTPLKSNILTVATCLDHLLDRLTPSYQKSDVGPSMYKIFTPLITTSPGSTTAPSGTSSDGFSSVIQMATVADTVQLASIKTDTGRVLQDHIISRVLPCLRMIALCWARWQDSFRVYDENSPGPVAALSLPFVGTLSTPKNVEPKENQVVKEFLALSSFVEIRCHPPILEIDEDNPVLGVGPLLPFVQEAALRSRLTESLDGPAALDELLRRWINQMSSAFIPPAALSGNTSVGYMSIPTEHLLADDPTADGSMDMLPVRQSLRPFFTPINRPPHGFGVPQFLFTQSATNQWKVTHTDWIMYLGPIMSIGRQLYPPRLIRPPRAFDDLFNSLHLVNCASSRHQFQKNVLCLVCGQLLCDLCFPNLAQLMFQHSYRCEGFSGVALEINTSLVHVSLGMSTCEWGSIYLDSYGEEDLDLKRGKPLFLNEERFTCLENQWLTHSFRHILKQWRHH